MRGKSQGNAIFEDGNLPEPILLAFGLLAGCNLQHQIKQALGRIGNGLTVGHRAGVEVDPARLLGGQLAVAGDLDGGAGAPKGVPRPVVKSTMCAPAAVMAVAETRSLPGP